MNEYKEQIDSDAGCSAPASAARHPGAGLSGLAAVLLLCLFACTNGGTPSGASAAAVHAKATAISGVPASVTEGQLFLMPANVEFVSAFPPSDPTCSGTPLLANLNGAYGYIDVGSSSHYLSLITGGQTGLVRWTEGSTPGGQDIVSCDVAGTGIGVDVTEVVAATTLTVPTTAPNATYTAMLGWPISAEANMRMYSLPRTATGSVDLKAYGPNDSNCSKTPAYDSGAVSLLAGFARTSFTPILAGSYNWVLSYAGDDLYAAVNTACGATTTQVLPVGTTFTVNDTNDVLDDGAGNCTLRGALAAANGNSIATAACGGLIGSAIGIDTISFANGLGAITLGSTLSVTDNLYIEGAADGSTVIGGGTDAGLGNGLGSAPGVMVRMDGVGLLSSLVSHGGELDLNGVSLTGTQMIFRVGANNSDGRYKLSNVSVQNSALTSAALEDAYAPILYIDNSLFSGNSNSDGAAGGGGGAVLLRNIDVSPQDGISFVRISNSSFTSNEADYGGAIDIYYKPNEAATYDPDGLTVSILASTFSGNNAGLASGGPSFAAGSAIYQSTAAVIIANSTFSGNAANVPADTLDLPDQPSAPVGGAIAFDDLFAGDGTTDLLDNYNVGKMNATLLLLNDSFVNNSSQTDGNIPANIAASIGVDGTYFQDESGDDVEVPTIAWLIVKNTFFSAVIPYDGVSPHGCTDENNNSALAFSGGSTFTNIDNSVMENGGTGPGGTGGTGPSCGSWFSGTASYDADPTENNLDQAHFHLLPLADNGGPTMTVALDVGSPMIGAGSNLACAEAGPTDQRGVPRPTSSNCSVGAYEADQAVPPAPTNLIGYGVNGGVELSWSASTDTTSYDLYQVGSGGSLTLVASGITGTSYSVTGLTNDDSYQYVVVAEDGTQPSADSNTATVTAGNAMPNNFSFISVTGATAGSTVSSNTITLSGIQAPATISIDAGYFCINSQPCSNVATTVQPGDTVSVELNAPLVSKTSATASLVIGGVSGTFTVTTQ